MTLARRLPGSIAAACPALSVAACSSSSDQGTGQSGLAVVMASVSGDGPAKTYFEYGDLGRLRALQVVDPAAVQDRATYWDGTCTAADVAHRRC